MNNNDTTCNNNIIFVPNSFPNHTHEIASVLAVLCTFHIAVLCFMLADFYHHFLNPTS